MFSLNLITFMHYILPKDWLSITRISQRRPKGHSEYRGQTKSAECRSSGSIFNSFLNVAENQKESEKSPKAEPLFTVSKKSLYFITYFV